MAREVQIKYKYTKSLGQSSSTVSISSHARKDLSESHMPLAGFEPKPTEIKAKR